MLPDGDGDKATKPRIPSLHTFKKFIDWNVEGLIMANSVIRNHNQVHSYAQVKNFNSPEKNVKG